MRIFYSVLIFLFLIGCAPKPDPNIQIRQAVAATIAAIPTYTPYPQPTPYPLPTAVSLAGLFCEYQFCIGHPADMAFYDVSAVNTNQATPSTYQNGLMAAISGNLFIQLIWQFSPGATDPQFLLDLVMEELDTRGNMDVKLIRDLNVLYTPITTTVTPILPFGSAAAWVCGERVFAWKAYTTDAGSAEALFNDALGRFTCK